jgi:hypothetical protein
MADACTISIPFSTCEWTVTSVEQTVDCCDGVIGERVEMQFLPPQAEPVIRNPNRRNPTPTFFDVSSVFRPADRVAFRQPIMP